MTNGHQRDLRILAIERRQLWKVEPAPGVAVSETSVPKSYSSSQSSGQAIPVGDDVTTPSPAIATFRGRGSPPPIGRKLAVTTWV